MRCRRQDGPQVDMVKIKQHASPNKQTLICSQVTEEEGCQDHHYDCQRDYAYKGNGLQQKIGQK